MTGCWSSTLYKKQFCASDTTVVSSRALDTRGCMRGGDHTDFQHKRILQRARNIVLDLFSTEVKPIFSMEVKFSTSHCKRELRCAPVCTHTPGSSLNSVYIVNLLVSTIIFGVFSPSVAATYSLMYTFQRDIANRRICLCLSLNHLYHMAADKHARNIW